eukprot:TRINITY_DN18258_c2_g1_i1.p1 TRINITY_DN18258_c2_g1~~TRINITY_DN18258_c2_g1_i1.p1  ORF type:complete len:161 (+),score=16.74 TRINITY_DN18258_c2_g1_i1:2-484(+)
MDANEECKLTFGRRFNNVSPEYKDFVVSTVVASPKRRLSEQRASAHPWLAGETDSCNTPGLQASFLGVGVDSSASVNCVPSTDLERTHSLPTAQRNSTARKSGTRSFLSKAKTVGRSIVGTLSRAVDKTRRNTSKVSPLGSKYEDTKEGSNAMAGILISD